MTNNSLKPIDRTLVQVEESLGGLHAWLDNPIPVDLRGVREQLEYLKIPSDQFFLGKKRDSLLKHISAMEAYHSPNFTQKCIEFFENLVPSEDEVMTAQKILQENPPVQDEIEKKLNPEEVAEGIKKAISARGLEKETIVVFPYTQAGTVSIQPYLTKPCEIRVSPTTEKTPQALEKTIAHEIEGHLYRSLNGRLQFPQSSFYSGTSGGYLLTEEGFTDQIETIRGLGSTDRTSAAHVIAVNAMLKGATKEEIKSLLIKSGIKEKAVESITTKVKRGVDPNEEGGYVGGAAYLLGRMRVGDYLKNGGKLETLYVGKISLEDVPIVEEMLTTGELKRPKYTL